MFFRSSRTDYDVLLTRCGGRSPPLTRAAPTPPSAMVPTTASVLTGWAQHTWRAAARRADDFLSALRRPWCNFFFPKFRRAKKKNCIVCSEAHVVRGRKLGALRRPWCEKHFKTKFRRAKIFVLCLAQRMWHAAARGADDFAARVAATLVPSTT